MKCLHCELSEILMRRQAQGEPVDNAMIFSLCEVIGDVAASQPTLPEKMRVMEAAARHLARFAGEIITDTYFEGRQVSDPNGVHERKH